jgi:hypothetical protein
MSCFGPHTSLSLGVDSVGRASGKDEVCQVESWKNAHRRVGRMKMTATAGAP